MDTARQIIRWALPGWIMFLLLSGFIMIGIVIHGNNQPFYSQLFIDLQKLYVPIGIVSIPIGFIIYQTYYWVYWYFPIPSIANRKLVDPGDRGKEILSDVKDTINFEQLFGSILINSPQTAFIKKGPIYYKSPYVMSEYRHNWHLSDSVWYLALSSNKYKNVADFLERRNQFLSDIYHSLGTCQIAAAFAYFSYLCVALYGLYAEQSIFTVFLSMGVFLRLGSLVINSLCFFLIYNILRGGRMASFDALLQLKHDVITNTLLFRPLPQEKVVVIDE